MTTLGGRETRGYSSGGQSGSSLLADISNAMVSALKTYYGKGPTKAKSYMVDDYLIVAMQDPFTVVEHTLMRAGKHDLVRDYRQTFQNEMTAELTNQVENLTGRRVRAYQSQVVFDPDVIFEIFILDEAGNGESERRATADEQIAEGAATDAPGEAYPG